MLLIGYLLLALVVAAVLFYAVVALLPAGLSVTAERDNRPFVLPEDRQLRPDDLQSLRIPVSVRGYRFRETDDLIDRLAAEIVARDEEIARLRGQQPARFERPAGGKAATTTMTEQAERAGRTAELDGPSEPSDERGD